MMHPGEASIDKLGITPPASGARVPTGYASIIVRLPSIKDIVCKGICNCIRITSNTANLRPCFDREQIDDYRLRGTRALR